VQLCREYYLFSYFTVPFPGDESLAKKQLSDHDTNSQREIKRFLKISQNFFKADSKGENRSGTECLLDSAILMSSLCWQHWDYRWAIPEGAQKRRGISTPPF
jgi:hypothetical protein